MDKLKLIITKVFRVSSDEVHELLSMDEVSAWDSLTHMDLIASLEEAFDIEFTLDDIMEMRDFRSIELKVKEKLAK